MKAGRAKHGAPSLNRSSMTEWGQMLVGAGGVGTLVGILSSKEVLAGALFLLGLGYFLRDYGRRSTATLTPMSLYMVASGIWFGLANLIGFWSIGTRLDSLFVEWRVERFLEQAQRIAMLGVLAPMLGYVLGVRALQNGIRLTPVGFEVSERAFLRVGWIFLVVAWVFRILEIRSTNLGTLGSLVTGAANFSILIFSTHLARNARPTIGLSGMVALMVTLETGYQLAFSFLRSDVILPFLAFLLPYLIEKRLTYRMLALGACVSVGFLLILQPFGILRSNISGTVRLNRLFVDARTDSSGLEEGTFTLISRLSTFSQLSQICRIVDDEGYLNGETLKYFAFVLIPRAIWPDKPRIAPGQWFAAKIGRGTQLEDGRFSNAINMTMPGELFLNFGWFGAITGGMLYGVLLAFGWDAARVRPGTRNPIGLMLAFTLIVQASGTGAHIGYVVNVVLWYLLAIGLTFVCRFWLIPVRTGRTRFIEAPGIAPIDSPRSPPGAGAKLH